MPTSTRAALTLFAGVLTMNAVQAQENRVLSAVMQSRNRIEITTQNPVTEAPRVVISPEVDIRKISVSANRVSLETDALDIRTTYRVSISGLGEKPVALGAVLDEFYSEKPLGYELGEKQTTFRLFSPRANSVELVLFDRPDSDPAGRYAMAMDEDGVWELVITQNLAGKYYAYSVDGPAGQGEVFDPDKLIADPYSPAVATRNDYKHEGRTLIFRDDYDWEGDTFLQYDWRDLIIMEAHVRDLTAHPSAGIADSLRGSYKALLDPETPGGLNYLKDLGVNAVELLPVHDFGNIEIPYKDKSLPVENTWNPYERNHWGYMTSYFFAPESYYASGESLEPGRFSGADGRAVREFKDVVKALHREGIAVIIDVVYNHVAQYDQNCFKLADKKYYFRLDDELEYQSRSWCGNDFKTERPMARRLIVDSVVHWLKEYHVDGFRFDLAALIDWETVDAITQAARAINPNVILIAEPWGGGEWEPAEFSRHGWAAWNDQIRNGIKGQNPKDGHGFIFGRWQGNNSPETIANYMRGTLAKYGGLFQETAHSVNYLESHDDHTLGDFIRLGSGAVAEDSVITDVDANALVRGEQLALNRFAALCLFVSQGPVMISQGQDWARSKVIAPTDVPDAKVGHIDHNSYEKDDETNWLNWRHREMNRDLVDYYRGLIALRKAHPALGKTPAENLRYLPLETPFGLAFTINPDKSLNDRRFFVILNANPEMNMVVPAPPGRWQVVVDSARAGTKGLIHVDGGTNIVVRPVSGMVLRSLP